MIKLLSACYSIVSYICLFTFALQVGALGYLWWNGTITADRNTTAFDVLYGLDRTSLGEELVVESLAPTPLSYRDIRQYRLKIALDQDLRGSSMAAGVDDLQNLEEQFTERKRRFERMRESFEKNYSQLEGVATNKSLTETREILQGMNPSQAADYLAGLMASGEQSSRNDAVAIMKTLSPGSQKKILAQFKDPQKKQHLKEVLNQIRLGMPEMSVVRAARQELSRYRDTLSDRIEP